MLGNIYGYVEHKDEGSILPDLMITMYYPPRKRCIVCGCLMDAKHDSDLCENCFDDMEDPEEVDS